MICCFIQLYTHGDEHSEDFNPIFQKRRRVAVLFTATGCARQPSGTLSLAPAVRKVVGGESRPLFNQYARNHAILIKKVIDNCHDSCEGRWRENSTCRSYAHGEATLRTEKLWMEIKKGVRSLKKVKWWRQWWYHRACGGGTTRDACTVSCFHVWLTYGHLDQELPDGGLENGLSCVTFYVPAMELGRVRSQAV